MRIIKPHHFIDIFKLFGAGIEEFVPDVGFNHDFYKVANEIVNDMNCKVTLTIEGDDICKPCNRFDGEVCTDPLIGIVDGFEKKDIYNKAIDSRIIKQLNLDTDKVYTVKELLAIMEANENIIFDVWMEEDNALTSKRNELFRKGLNKSIEAIAEAVDGKL